jgi:hypothetical protein
MTIDRKYEMMPTFRRIAKVAYPLWMLALASKIFWLLAPMQTHPELVDQFTAIAMSGLAIASILAWYLAALGSSRERFPSVMAFNMLSFSTLFLV